MSGYVHSGINPMIKVEPYKHENKLLVADKFGNAKVSNLKESDLVNIIETVNTLSNGKSNSNEEQFEKVYETTLEEAISQPIIIGPTELNGAYIDALVSIEFIDESALDGVRVGFLQFADNPNNAVWIDTVPTGDYAVYVSLLSFGGLMFSTIQDTQNNGALKFEGVVYPGSDSVFQKIVAITVVAVNGGNAGTIPSGTTITVYARHKVTGTAVTEDESQEQSPEMNNDPPNEPVL